MEVNEGDDVTLECIADSLPKPRFTWLNKDGVELTNATERVTVSSQTLKEDGVHGTEIKSILSITDVKHADDCGSYTCVASNSIGSDSLVIHVNGTGKPMVFLTS